MCSFSTTGCLNSILRSYKLDSSTAWQMSIKYQRCNQDWWQKLYQQIYLQNPYDTLRSSRVMNQAGIKSSYLSSRFNMIPYSYKLNNNIQWICHSQKKLPLLNKGTASLYIGVNAMKTPKLCHWVFLLLKLIAVTKAWNTISIHTNVWYQSFIHMYCLAKTKNQERELR